MSIADEVLCNQQKVELQLARCHTFKRESR
jgi:hypothetical protein